MNFPKERVFIIENPNRAQDGKRLVELNIEGLGIPPVEYTASGMPSVDAKTLIALAGDPDNGKYGKIGEFYEGKPFGIEMSKALDKYLKYKATETLQNNFINPLQKAVDESGRIHCSLNIGTETGRLASRKPNL